MPEAAECSENPPIIGRHAVAFGYFRWFLLAGAVLGLILLGILFFFDPARSTFYPGCMFRQLTGWLCPGCGGLRATHQLLHGNITAAFQLNPLVVLVLPVFAFAGLWNIRRPASRWPQVCLYATLGISLAFGVLRNL